MRLFVTTPLAVVVDEPDVVHVRAEDATGAFGILPHHTELLTALAVSVLSWRRADGREGHCAVRGGVLEVRGGELVAVATREAARSDDLGELAAAVRAQRERERDEEARSRTGEAQLELAVIRRLVESLDPRRRKGGAP